MCAKRTTAQLQNTLRQLQASQLSLIQHEKMSALENLVAGVAHEINNPLSFLSGNVGELKVSLKEITEYINLYETLYPSPGNEIIEKRKQLDLDFLLQDLPKMLTSMEMGCDRLQRISTSLRAFSRSDTTSKIEANIHQLLDSTLLLLKYRLKAKNIRPEIQVTRIYGNLPKDIACFPGQLNQVFMNLFANAVDMFDELAEEQTSDSPAVRQQTITVQTDYSEGNAIVIQIQDNGKGMPTEVCSRIFDRQFTTKVVGKGTGLGLTIAKQIIEEKHGGQITVNSTPGRGTTFVITLPV
ncbi:MAG: ATP-binding protein [Cyanobacteria bacterium P01_F01_bin.116]